MSRSGTGRDVNSLTFVQPACPPPTTASLTVKGVLKDGFEARRNSSPVLSRRLLCLLELLILRPELCPMLGNKIACAAVSPHLYILSYECSVTRHSGSCTPTSEISVVEFVVSGKLL